MRVSSPTPQSHERYERIFAEVEAPFAFVDLDAMWAEEMALRDAAAELLDAAIEGVALTAMLAGALPPAA